MERIITLILTIIIVGAMVVGIDFFAAQCIAFGLSYFHVKTGLTGPLWIVVGITAVSGSSARLATK